MEVEAPEASIDSLRNSGLFVSLDAKLAFALLKILPAALKRKVPRAQDVELRDHYSVMNGRQILFMIYHHLRTNPTLSTFYNIEDLQDVQWGGDSVEAIEKFLDDWLRVTQGMRDQLSDAQLAEVLFIQRNTSKSS